MIDKEKVREAIAWAFPVNDYNTNDNKKAIEILVKLAELYLSGKLIEPMSKEEIGRIIKNHNVNNMTVHLANMDIEAISEAIFKVQGDKK